MAEDSRLSSVIDEEGRLFGVINVIDALVVLLVVAVVAAGLALVVPSGGTGETRYATVDLGAQPEYKADQITAGDRWDIAGSGDDLTITEVFAAPRSDGDRDVVIRAAINGTTLDPQAETENAPIEFAGEPLRFGHELEIETSQYVVSGTVTDVSTDEQIGTPATRSVVVQATDVSDRRANRLGEGMNEVLGDTETATVTNVERQARDEGGQDVTLVLSLNVQEQADETVLFRGERLRFDQSLTLELDGTVIEGEVVDIG